MRGMTFSVVSITAKTFGGLCGNLDQLAFLDGDAPKRKPPGDA
ncbi:hypothetical protein N185_09440 [Sinorhizobium sp. GW3]|nr:hypothetical protein N185_09440 [Sinorhizobium sp. GW3]